MSKVVYSAGTEISSTVGESLGNRLAAVAATHQVSFSSSTTTVRGQKIQTSNMVYYYDKAVDLAERATLIHNVYNSYEAHPYSSGKATASSINFLSGDAITAGSTIESGVVTALEGVCYNYSSNNSGNYSSNNSGYTCPDYAAHNSGDHVNYTNNNSWYNGSGHYASHNSGDDTNYSAHNSGDDTNYGANDSGFCNTNFG